MNQERRLYSIVKTECSLPFSLQKAMHPHPDEFIMLFMWLLSMQLLLQLIFLLLWLFPQRHTPSQS